MTNHPFCCHTAVTLLSRSPSYTTTPPYRAKFAVTLLSHYCHTTITGAISSPKINFFPQRISSFPRKSPLFSRKCPIYPRKHPIFSRKTPTFPRKSGTSSKKALTLLRSLVTDVTEKNTKLLVYTRASARVEIKAIIYRALVTCNHGERCCYGRTVESPHDYVLVASRVN